MSSEPSPIYSVTGKRVWVAGHNGMVGRAILRRLEREDCRILTVDRTEVDLRRQAETEDWMAATRPQAVFVAAARVGGICANDTRPAEFIYENLAIETNVIEGARRVGVEKLLFLGSSCIYPKLAPQPIREDALLTGPLEPTNEWYAIAKIAGVKLCQAYRRQYGCDFLAVQPSNLYGAFDNFDLQSSHVIPALMAKAHRAKMRAAPVLEVWGSGTPLREFLYVDDLAGAVVFLMRHYTGPIPVNIGSGEELTIGELGRMVAEVVGFCGEVAFDSARPDGAPRKRLDLGFLHGLGWRHKTPLRQGLAQTYDWYRENVAARTHLQEASTTLATDVCSSVNCP